MAALWIFFQAALCAFEAGADQSPGVGESHYQVLSRSVIRLERTPPPNADDSALRQPVGTGFLVRYQHALYLVSVRHIAEIGVEIAARVPAPQSAGKAGEVIELRVPATAWRMHDTAANKRPMSMTVRPVDVAVARLPWPQSHALAPLDYCAEDCRAGPSQLSAVDPEPPEEILLFGYPRFLGIALELQRPLARFGIIAMKADEPFIHHGKGEALLDGRTLIVDVRAFPGNSGSPVFRKAGFTGRRIVVAMVSAGGHPSDLTFAEPVSRIKETIAIAHNDNSAGEARWLLPAAAGYNRQTNTVDPVSHGNTDLSR